ncbi:MAG: hypothetical protein HOG49_14985 [Candidatus Scalindua sp.]|nr:hypothetical protein [Candidatus Scalindua sp.]
MLKDTIIVDIDGCLNHYPDPLKMWAEVFLNLDQAESRQAIEKKNDFELLKKTYRQSNILKYLLPKGGAKEVLGDFKKNGYFITLLTLRNPNKNPQIKTITENWLHKYNIPYDSIVYTKDKNAYIKKNESKVIMVVEDESEPLNSFKKLKTEVIVFKNDLNKNIQQPHFHTVSSWKEISSLSKHFMVKRNYE